LKYKATKLSALKIILLTVNSLSLIVIFYTTSYAPCGVGVRPYSTGFGTVSVLVPHSKLILLSNYLNQTVYAYLAGKINYINAKDLIIDTFKRENNLSEFIIEPSIVQHIGLHSSLYSRDSGNQGYKKMYKSFSWPDSKKLIRFDSSWK